MSERGGGEWCESIRGDRGEPATAPNAKGFVTIRLEDSLRAQMQKLADDSERSLSAQIRLAIREHLKNGAKS